MIGLFILKSIFSLQMVFGSTIVGKVNEMTFSALSQVEAATFLEHVDSYLSSMSLFDRQIRTQNVANISLEDYQRIVGADAREFTLEEMNRLEYVIEDLREAYEQLRGFNLSDVRFIKVAGETEFGFPYTRENVIIFPQNLLNAPYPDFKEIFSHEFFHLISRNNSGLRDRLYTLIHFRKADRSIEVPDWIRSQSITNPDEPLEDYVINIQYEGENYMALPVWYSELAASDIDFEHFDLESLLSIKLLLIDQNHLRPLPLIVSYNDTNIFDLIGRNTGYIIHPEEILAENFKSMISIMNGESSLGQYPDPHIIEQMQGIFLD